MNFFPILIVEFYSLHKVRDILDLLGKYGYQLNQMQILFRKQLIKIGDPNKIEAVLETLEELKIHFIKENTNAFAYLLLYSSPSIIKNLVTLYQKYLLDLTTIVKIPSIFIPIDIHFDTVNSKQKINDSTRKLGAYEYFESNIGFLHKDLNMFIEKVYAKKPLLFAVPTMVVKENAKLFKDRYGFYFKYNTENPPSYVLRSLCTGDPADTIDSYIEAGAYAYIKNNPDKLKTGPKSAPFYRLYYASKMGISIQNRDDSDISMIGDIHKEGGLGITKENASTKVKEYIPELKKGSFYETILTNSYNTTITEASTCHPYIQKLDLFYKQNSCIYNIDGILISRNKVLRFFETLLQQAKDVDQVLLFAILRNKIVNKEDYEILERAVSSCIEAVHSDNKEQKAKERILKKRVMV